VFDELGTDYPKLRDLGNALFSQPPFLTRFWA
jgi:hypothetical protein